MDITVALVLGRVYTIFGSLFAKDQPLLHLLAFAPFDAGFLVCCPRRIFLPLPVIVLEWALV